MFDGNRLLSIAFGLAPALLLALCLAMASVEYAYDDPRERAEQHESANAEPPSVSAPDPVGVEATPEPHTAQENEYYLREDLAAQRGMAVIAAMQILLTAGGLVLLWQTLEATRAAIGEARSATAEAQRGAVASELAAEQARRAADIAQQQLEESRLPALFVDVQNIEIAEGEIPRVQMRIRNMGSTFAVLTGGKVELRYTDKTPIPSRMGMTDDAYFAVVGGHPLSPGEPYVKEIACLDEKADPNAAKVQGPNFYLFGWIEYRDQWRTHYVLPFCLFYAKRASQRVPERFIEVDVAHVPIGPETYADYRPPDQDPPPDPLAG